MSAATGFSWQDASCATSPRRRRRGCLARPAPRRRRLIGCRRTPWASCSTSCRSPTTSLHGADVPRFGGAAKIAQVAAVLWRVVTLAGHNPVLCAAAAPERLVPARQRRQVWRDGACERTIQAHSDWVNAVVLPGALRQRLARRTAKLFTSAASSAHLRGGLAALRRGDARRRARGRPLPEFGCTTSRDARPPSRAHGLGGAVAVTPTASIISGSRQARQGVERRHRLVSTCAGHTPRSRWRRCPTASASSAAGRQHRPRVTSTASSRTFRAAQRRDRPRGAARQPARSRLGDRTVKLFNVNDGAVLHLQYRTRTVFCLALLPTASASSAAVDRTARIAYHGLAPQNKLNF